MAGVYGEINSRGDYHRVLSEALDHHATHSREAAKLPGDATHPHGTGRDEEVASRANSKMQKASWPRSLASSMV
jgi:hypothetical protein